jgi:DNA-binding MarR family transcriptional regulator
VPRRSDADARSAAAIADRVHSAAIHILRRVRRSDADSGLSPARLSALSVIVFGGPITMSQLAAAEQVAVPTMTRLLGALERDGLVERQRDARDGRVAWLRPTAKGTKVLQEGRRRRVAALAADLATLGERELATLARAADILEDIARRSARS